MRPALPRPFPDDHEVLLLRAALCDGQHAIDAWRRWRLGSGERERDDTSSHRLFPLVYRNLRYLGIEDSDMVELRGAYRYSWSSNKRLFNAAAGIIQALAAEGIETLTLKGAAMAVLYYSDSGARPMGDFDLLVRLRDAKRAVHVLWERGWTIDLEAPLDQLLAARHAVSCRHGQHEIDLHWQALYQVGDDEPFWAESIPIELGYSRTRALRPEHQLIHVGVHGVGLDPAPVRWIADALTIIRSVGDRFDWDVVVHESRVREATVAVTVALRFLAQTLSAPIPPQVLEELARSRASLGEQLAYRAATSTRRGRGFVVEWRRYRALRRLGYSLATGSYLTHLQYMWGLPNRRQVFRRFGRKVVQVIRYGYSHPRGARLLGGRRLDRHEAPRAAADHRRTPGIYLPLRNRTR